VLKSVRLYQPSRAPSSRTRHVTAILYHGVPPGEEIEAPPPESSVVRTDIASQSRASAPSLSEDHVFRSSIGAGDDEQGAQWLAKRNMTTTAFYWDEKFQSEIRAGRGKFDACLYEPRLCADYSERNCSTTRINEGILGAIVSRHAFQKSCNFLRRCDCLNWPSQRNTIDAHI
jgi:hypothetical protein